MKFKIGDVVKVICMNTSWPFWMSGMSKLLGTKQTIYGEFELGGDYYPTIIIEGGYSGVEGGSEYGFPEECLKLVHKPGEQLLFDFMTEDYNDKAN